MATKDEPESTVAPTGARKIPSARATEKYGAVAAPIAKETGSAGPAARASSVPPPVLAPEVLAAPKRKKDGYVFPAKRATDLEDEDSSKATSLDLTAVPSSILERANLADTDRLERVTPPRPWLPWAVGTAVVLAIGALIAAVAMR